MTKNLFLFVLVTLIGQIFLGCLSVKRPEIAAPVEFPDSFSLVGEGVLPDRWWLSFDDPDLNGLIERALSGNFSILSAWDRLNEVEQIARKAGVKLLPEADYQGGAQRTRQELSGGVSYFSDFSVSIVANYELDLWGKVRSSRQAAILDSEAAREDVISAAVTLSANVAKVWFRLIEAFKQKEVILSQLEANEKILDLVKAQFYKGFVRATDVLRQKQLIESTQGALNLAEENIVLLQNELSVLIGEIPMQRWRDLDRDLIELPEFPLLELPSEVILRRPDIRNAFRRVQAADYRVGEALADRFPSIGISSTVSTSSGKVSDLFDDWYANIAGNILGALFDAGYRKAEYERTRAVLSQAVNDYGQKILLAVKEVEDVLNREYYEIKRYKNIKNQLSFSRKVFERTREHYIKGQTDFLRVLDAQISMQLLERGELSARRSLLEIRVDLCRSITGGWDLKRPEKLLNRRDEIEAKHEND